MSDRDKFDEDYSLAQRDASFIEDKIKLSEHLGVPFDDVIQAIRDGRSGSVLGSRANDPFDLDAMAEGLEKANRAIQDISKGMPQGLTDPELARWAARKLKALSE